MKTILVLTDFSEPAMNAALYALKLANQLKASKVILYNMYQVPPLVTEPATMPSVPIVDIESVEEISSANMRRFRDSLKGSCPEGVQMESISEFGDITAVIDDVCTSTNAGLIVCGITGTSKIEEALIGSTAISVGKNTKVPVIIVPQDAGYTAINNIVWACDFKKVAETTPVQPIKSILDATDAVLHVLNVQESDKDISNDQEVQKQLVSSLFEEYEPAFHFERNEDFIAGINDFVESNNMDLIITIPKKHGFFDGLFKERHIKKLAFHSHVPLMFIHEGDL